MRKIEIDAFYSELVKVVDSVAQKQNATLKEIAETISVSYSTLWRWKSPKYLKRAPHPTSVLQLLQIHSKTDRITETIECYRSKKMPQLTYFLEKHFPAAKKGNLEDEAYLDAKSILKDKYDYLIFKLSGNAKKYTKTQLNEVVSFSHALDFIEKESLDQDSLPDQLKSSSHLVMKKIDRLLGLEALFLDQDKVTTGKINMLLDFNTSMRYASPATELFKARDINQKDAMARGYQESIDEETIRVIEEKITNLHEEIFHLMNNNKNEKGIPFNYFFTAARFTNEREAQV